MAQIVRNRATGKLECTNNVTRIAALFGREKRPCETLRTRTPRTTTPVHIVFVVIWTVVVHDQNQLLHIKPARRNGRRNEQLHPTLLEIHHRRITIELIDATVQTHARTTDRPPTCTSIGFFRIRLASASIWRGNVALNITVCLSGRTLSMMRITCGSNPMSNIRSASSNTTYVTRRRFVTRPEFAASMSIIRPGVHTMISAPRFNSAICSEMPVPPYTQAVRRLSDFENFFMSLPICMQSSRVGVMMIATGPSPSSSAGWSRMCRNMGTRFAAVSLISSCSSSEEYSSPSWFCSISSPFFVSAFCLATPVMIVTPLPVITLPSGFGSGLDSLFTFRTSSFTSFMKASSGSISSSSSAAASALSFASSSSSSSSSSSRLHFFAPDAPAIGTTVGSATLFLFLVNRCNRHFVHFLLGETFPERSGQGYFLFFRQLFHHHHRGSVEFCLVVVLPPPPTSPAAADIPLPCSADELAAADDVAAARMSSNDALHATTKDTTTKTKRV
uniref:Uncharacterized protein n=1 Tax=Anopheles farauti TaxID=69004 RepID=A0A182QQ22_9DIPT